MRDSYSSNSFRLIAVAMAVLPNMSQSDMDCMSQHQIEAAASPFRLLGIIVLTNPVKPDSKDIIAELQDRRASCALCVVVCLSVCLSVCDI